MRVDAVWVTLRPFVSLQPAHGRANRRSKLLDTEAVDQGFFDPDEILDADDGKAHPVGLASVGVDACRSGGDDVGHISVEIDERVGGQHEIFVGIDGLARANDRIPIA